MTYEYDIKKKAMKFIRKQQPKQQQRILEAIYALPLTGDVKKLKGEDGFIDYVLVISVCFLK